MDVLFVSDQSGSATDNYPNGSALLDTYLASRADGLTRMPNIPPPDEIVQRGLNKRPVLFGCRDRSKLTIVWLPNQNYTFNSGQPYTKFRYSESETKGV